MSDIQTVDKLINTELLQETINKSGLREDYLFTSLDITRQNWIDKKKGRLPFKVPEIFMLCALLHIEDDNLKNAIFYP
jgi:hypothetical protein